MDYQGSLRYTGAKLRSDVVVWRQPGLHGGMSYITNFSSLSTSYPFSHLILLEIILRFRAALSRPA